MNHKPLALIAATLLTSTLTFAHNFESNELSQFDLPRTLIGEIQFSNFQVGMTKLHHTGVDIAGIDSKNHRADVVINESELKELEEMGFDIRVKMTNSLKRAPDADYKTSAEVEAILKDFHAKYPELTEIKVVGKSLLGNNIWALKISDNAKIHEANEPAVLFNGMHHAREVMGPEVALDIIETLLEGYGSDNTITHWVDANEIWVMPMFNVDGNNIVWTKDNMWRKNARGGYGVDINRNYPYAWGTCNGSSTSTYAQDFRGPSAASEPETNVMMNLVKEIRPVFDISYHSYSELVIYPFGCKGRRTPNADVVEGIGKNLGSLLGYKAGTAWETLYSVDGGDIDWMYSEYQVIPYVIEVNSSSDGFQPDFAVRQETVELNRKGWQTLLSRLDESGIRGMVTVQGRMVPDFKVVLEKKSPTGFSAYMTYKGNADGSYHLVVNPGAYRVTVSGPGIETVAKEILVNKVRVDANFSL